MRYADVSYYPDVDEDFPWNIALYSGAHKTFVDHHYCESRGARNHEEAIMLASDWVNYKGVYALRSSQR